MIKRIISGLLSAVMSTVLITADFNNARQVDEKTNQNAEKTFLDNGFSVNSTNSLGNYINDAMQQKEQPQKMSNQMSNYNYDVGFAEFDKETKKLNVYSSQSTDVKVSVVFKDEDTAESVYTAEYEAERGENTFNTYDVEVTSLPEFFTVDVMLFDSFNTPVCEPYTITTYTRFIQEMKATDIHDFEEEYVVNLDEDETTNFIVLNENTIKAETTDDTNILVSADYEKDQYVFEHIDETIRYLDKGDHFFIQPTEEDIIALSVGDISIDGDRAVLTGDGNIDGMFDVIKIDTDINDVSDASVIEDDMPENMNYNGIVEDENGLSALDFTFGESYSYDADDPNNIPINWNFKFGVGTKELRNDDEDDALESLTVNKLKEIPEATVMKLKEDKANNKLGKFEKGLELSGDVKIEANLKYHFYWKWFHVEFELAMDPTITVEIEAKGEGQFPFGTPPVVVMVFPGLWFGFKPELSFKFEGDLKYKNTFSVDCILSFDTSREKKFSSSCEPVANPIDKDADNELLIEANVAISLDLCPIIYFIDENVISLAISMPAELGLEISTNDLSLDIAERTSLPPHTVYLGDMYYDKDTIHTCDYCFELRPYLKWEGNLVCNILCIPFLNEVSINLFEFEVHTKDEDDDGDDSNHWFDKLYFSFTNREIDFGECPHQAYKTTFHISDLLYDSDQEAEVSVDRIKVKVDNHGFAEFYCENGTHDYTVLVDGEEIKSDSFKIEDAVKEFIISPFEDGQVIEGEKKETHEHTKSVSITDFVQDVPELSAEAKHIETGKLGENISYYIYPNGDMNIYGSGEMYDQLPTIVNKSKVKTVYFVDSSPEKNKYITSIGNGLFKDVKNLEIVYLSNEITKIGDEAFNGCKSLKYFRYGGEKDDSKTLILPSKLRSIGNSAFSGCSSAEFGDIVFNTNVNVIGSNAFRNCTKIKSITVESENAVIKDNAFYNCINTEELTLASFDFAKELTLGVGGFLGADKNEYTYFSNGDISVPLALKTINIKGGTIIPYRAFYGMKELEKITLPEGLTQIDAESFMDCSNAYIEGQKIFDNVEKIGQQAFQNCSKAEFGNIVFTDKTKVIDNFAFINCHGITSIKIEGEDTKVGQQAFMNCIKNTEADINIVNGTIGKEAFRNNNSLEKMTFTSLNWFKNSDTSIEGILSSDNTEYTYSVQYELYVPKSLKTINIKSGTIIPDRTFCGMKELEIITLPEGLTYIGTDSFENCSNAYIYGHGILDNAEIIGQRAFYNCSNVEFGNIVFTDKTKEIGNFAFINCQGITSIKIEGEDTKVGQQAFMNCTKNTETKINIVNGTIGKEAFRNNNSLEKITFASLNWFENSDTDIEGILASDDTEYTYPVQYGLYVPKSLKTINIKSGTIIPYRTFYGMKQLEEISLPKGIETIDGQAFYDCSGLKTIYFSEDIKLVERSAFHGCSEIEEVNYEGSDEQWDNIIIEDDNNPILRKNGKVNFNVPLWVKGDANGDGEIDMSDIVLIMQALANPNKYGVNGTDPTHITENGFKYGDINGDGLTVNDAVRIQEYLLGKISSLA